MTVDITVGFACGFTRAIVYISCQQVPLQVSHFLTAREDRLEQF